ncbi:UPF0271 protein [Rarobacter faecitabidus]|uniref:5-oxoprolinase subunit A n=2 Tax=Rarobacter faecitabidus TaxID=13243 RepID=A0A542ZV00_RARFA|nr:UPF0271 protein [Rarobacter faecitabidus]
MTVTMDLNADLGESFGPWRMGDDESLLGIVTSANLACGFHAGDPQTMIRTAAMARDAGVSIGAHISYADLRGFGRRPMPVTHDELHADVVYQLGAALGVTASVAVELTHAKPHGALYNVIATDRNQARTVARAIASVRPGLPVYGLAGSVFLDEARAAGLVPVPEAFADRAYETDGTLRPRSLVGAVLTDPDEIAARVVRLARRGEILAHEGSPIALAARTVCVHGETAHATAIARAIRSALEAAGVDLRAIEH